MKMLRYVIEFDGTIILNNEYTATASPVVIDWFDGVDLIIDDLQQRKIINNKNLGDDAIVITESLVIIRTKRHIEATVKQTHSMFIFPKKYTVQIADAGTTFFTIHDKGGERFALDLGVLLTEPKVESKNNKVEIVADGFHLIYDPHNNVVEKLHRAEFHHPTDSVPTAFLKRVKNKDFDSAKKFLSFDIHDSHLEKYFGEFELLQENYLHNPNIVTIIQGGKARNITFTLNGNLISNLE